MSIIYKNINVKNMSIICQTCQNNVNNILKICETYVRNMLNKCQKHVKHMSTIFKTYQECVRNMSEHVSAYREMHGSCPP